VSVIRRGLTYRRRRPQAFTVGILGLLLTLGGSAYATMSASGHQSSSPDKHVAAAAASGGLSVVYRAEEVPSQAGENGQGGYHASCPAGYLAVGGGFEVDNPHLQVVKSTPYFVKAPPAKAWSVHVANTDSVQHNVTIYVVCLAGAKFAHSLSTGKGKLGASLDK
jgi:hypothetical protein